MICLQIYLNNETKNKQIYNQNHTKQIKKPILKIICIQFTN